MVIDYALATWEDFLVLPDAEYGTRHELHDGEIVTMPPPRPVHIYVQSLLVQWLTKAAGGQGRAAQEFPYRPAKNLQFWYADVAYISNEDWQAMRTNEYPIYSPELIIEVLSPSNTPDKVIRQRVAAFSGGTQEFWVVDLDRQQIEVSVPGVATRIYKVGEEVPVPLIGNVTLPVSALF